MNAIPEPTITKTLPHGSAITAWETNDDYLAIAAEGDLHVFNFLDNTLTQLQSKGKPIWALVWWEQKNALITGGVGGEINIWDINTRSIIQKSNGHTATVRCLQIINGSTLIAGSRDTNICIWDLDSDSADAKLTLKGHTETVRCLQAYGDLVVTGSYDSDARIWDIHTGECLHVLKGHQGQIVCLRFDGDRIVTGSFDTHVRVWDPQSGSCLAVLSSHSGLVTRLELQGNSLISADNMGMVKKWSLDGTDSVELALADESSVVSMATYEDKVLIAKTDGSVRLINRDSGDTVTLLGSEVVWKVGFTQSHRPMAVYIKEDQTRLSVF